MYQQAIAVMMFVLVVTCTNSFVFDDVVWSLLMMLVVDAPVERLEPVSIDEGGLSFEIKLNGWSLDGDDVKPPTCRRR